MRDRAPTRTTMRPARATAAPAVALACAILASADTSLAQTTWTGHAVIVGISDYPGTVNDLDWCDDDAREIRDTLLSDGAHWSADNVRLLVNDAAGALAIQTALNEEFSETTPSGDVYLFFFSGHGTELPDAGGGAGDEDTGDIWDEAIVAYDALITDDDLATWFAAHDGKSICAIFDVCRAGGMAKSVDPSSDLWNAGLASDVLKALPTPAPATRDIQDTGQTGIVMLMACEDVELSEEDAILRNGVFSFYIIEALSRRAADADGNNFVSAEEAFTYAKPLVIAWNPDQTPELYDTYAEELDIIAAADRPLDRIVTPDDFPFGGDGCSGDGRPAEPAVGIWALVLAGGVAALLLHRRRTAALLILAVLLAPGCVGAAEERAPRWGIHAGSISPLDEKNAPYSPGPLAEASVRVPLPRDGTALELGGSIFHIEGDGYDVEATAFGLRGDVVLSRTGGASPWVPYMAAGPRVFFAGATTYWGGGFGGAWGVGIATGLWRSDGGAGGPEFRVGMDWFPETVNVGRTFSMTGGWRF